MDGNTVKPGRISAIDAFRGLTIALMIFANSSAGVSGLPEWMKHLPASADGFTYPDWVFPAFLFAMGLAMPLVLPRLKGPEFWTQLLLRAGSLIFLGVMMVNMETYDAAATGLGKPLFSLLFYASAFAVWGSPAWLRWPRVLGLVTLALLAFHIRHNSGGTAVGLRPEWWGILGMLGWCYLFAALAWRYTGSDRGRMIQVLIAMSALWILDRLSPVAEWFPPARVFGVANLAGSHAALVVAGMFCGSLALLGKPAARQSLLFGLALLAAGFLLRAWFPFSKIQGTLSWSLACAGLSALLFAACLRFSALNPAWVLDTGKNALFAYLLPMAVGALFDSLGLLNINAWGLFWWSGSGAAGALNAAAWTALMILLTVIATRKKFFLKL